VGAYKLNANTFASSDLAIRCRIAVVIEPASRKKEEDVRNSRVARWSSGPRAAHMGCADTID
jgi:hypothetical protein